MKLSDYVINFLIEKGVDYVFGMSGGAAVHLFDSVDKSEFINIISMTHEQCASMAADGYARSTGKIGVSIVTSGPGATNLLTGVCCSYYDSIPVMMITGQVATHRLKRDRKVRQLGFQETDIVEIFKPVTKYTAQIIDPFSIKYHLEKAYFEAFNGRPGPVLLDIPDDIQRCEIEPNNLKGFIVDNNQFENFKKNKKESHIDELIKKINLAKRPVVILGGGFKTPKFSGYKEILEKMNIPILLTWAGVDLIEFDHDLRIGTFGVYGSRLGNFVVQNADLVIALGTRLSQNLTGGILASFARDAEIVMVDIDINEISKFEGYGIKIKLGIPMSLFSFFDEIKNKVKNIVNNDFDSWKEIIKEWKVVLPNDFSGEDSFLDDLSVDSYHFIRTLSVKTRDFEEIYVDTGGNLTWTCNGLKIKSNQKLNSAWNNTPMGYSLPAAIGASFASIKKQITCIIGDGGLLICLSELATLARHKLPIKVILFNNHGHGIQKQTLQTWLDGKFVCVDEESGLSFPKDYEKLVEAFGIKYIRIDNNTNLDKVLSEVYNNENPILLDVQINPNQKLFPVLKFGNPLEMQMPFLDEIITNELMIIPKFSNSNDSNITNLQSKEGW